VDEAANHQEVALLQEAVMAHHEEVCEAHHHQAGMGMATREVACALLLVQPPWDGVFHLQDTTMTPMARACRSSASLRRMALEECLHLMRCSRLCRSVKLSRWIRVWVPLLRTVRTTV
jgi:hypothetical protein